MRIIPMPREALMNKYFLKYKFITLLALLPITGVVQSTDNHIEYVEHTDLLEFCNFIHHMVGNLDAFLDKNNNESYTRHLMKINKTIEKYTLNNDSVFRSQPCSEIAIRIRGIRKEFSQPFVKIQTVLKEYQGKDQSSAGDLVKNLRSTLPFHQLFSKLKKELLSLEKEALIQHDKKLASTIKRFIHYIDQKNTEWNKKSPLAIFNILCRRMNIR